MIGLKILGFCKHFMVDRFEAGILLWHQFEPRLSLWHKFEARLLLWYILHRIRLRKVVIVTVAGRHRIQEKLGYGLFSRSFGPKKNEFDQETWEVQKRTVRSSQDSEVHGVSEDMRARLAFTVFKLLVNGN